ncbi:RNA recognition motif. (a.k.a. RRM, RBD, or RNP domain), putative [Angomonas deanei]|uniref:RNA recognition motif. (A.k.a. RRM, RBD, or RNP domain), putative n=1 Tax=Angomonas deanei TaxID=59799 RepID=A0A7G2CR83_9TRYP|nr:RNA recognition motif. (a.k.a. RRM, RBD, or RNP domain), putative [Angomonas deanei]
MYADARLPFVAAGSPNNSSTSNPSNNNSDSRGMWGRQGYVMQPPPSYNADRPPSRGNNNTNTNMGSPPQYHQPPPPQRGTDYKEMNAGKANVRWFNSPNNNNNNNNTMLGVQPPMPYNPNLNHSPYTVSSPYNNNNNNNNNYNNNNNKSITGYPFSNTTPYPKYNNDNHTAVYGDGPAVRTNFYPTPSRYFPNEVNEHRSGGQWEEGVKLFVGQVPGVCTEAQLIPIFEPYGELLEVRIMRERDTHRSKGSAWVRYHTREAATAAIQALHEKYVIPPQTNPIRVQFALEKR